MQEYYRKGIVIIKKLSELVYEVLVSSNKNFNIPIFNNVSCITFYM